MTGTVLIKTLEFQGKHGASADERKTLRRFQVDVELRWDMTVAVKSDRLTDTVNYDEVCGMLVEIGTSPPVHLLEHLAGRMLEAIRAKWPFVEASLELRKLHPPCPGNPAFTAVRLS